MALLQSDIFESGSRGQAAGRQLPGPVAPLKNGAQRKMTKSFRLQRAHYINFTFMSCGDQASSVPKETHIYSPG
jgi:hypothetical protein